MVISMVKIRNVPSLKLLQIWYIRDCDFPMGLQSVLGGRIIHFDSRGMGLKLLDHKGAEYIHLGQITFDNRLVIQYLSIG